MDIVGKARTLERKIARTLDAAVDEFVGTNAAAPLEMVHAVLDRAEQEVQEVGRGKRLFPFNRVTVHVAAGRADHEARTRIAAVFEGPPSLAERLRSRLRSAGCRCDEIEVGVTFMARPRREWEGRGFDVTFERTETALAPEPAAASPSEPPKLKIAAVAGQTLQRGYVFKGGRIDIGRRADVVDARQRLIRTNHVAFAEDGPDANKTVSRRHAHIVYNETSGEDRVWDDRSVHGTSLVRRGHTLPVPAGSRGVRLQSGDEILLGQARLRVTIGQ